MFATPSYSKINVVIFIFNNYVYCVSKNVSGNQEPTVAGTVLALACACGTVAVVRELLDHGADVNHPSEHSSPMIYASEYNNVELLSLLLSMCH